MDKKATFEKAIEKICRENKIPESRINALLSDSEETRAVITRLSRQELEGLLSEIPEDKLEYFIKTIESVR